jgi:hypothetical protein
MPRVLQVVACQRYSEIRVQGGRRPLACCPFDEVAKPVSHRLPPVAGVKRIEQAVSFVQLGTLVLGLGRVSIDECGRRSAPRLVGCWRRPEPRIAKYLIELELIRVGRARSIRSA